MKKTKANVTVFANDSLPDDSLRKKMYPSYKCKRNNREKTDEEKALDAIAYPQFEKIENEVLPGMGYRNIFKFKGLEADDVIGKVCKTNHDCEIIIVTSDQDMYQLLTDRVCILKPQTMQYYSKALFEKTYGIKPYLWKRVKAIGGCDSDEVAGIPGVGEKTVLKYLKGKLPEHYKTHQSIISKKGRRIMNRNKPLVILPFRGTPECLLKPDAVSKVRVQGMAKQYGFKSIESDLENWVKILKGW